MNALPTNTLLHAHENTIERGAAILIAYLIDESSNSLVDESGNILVAQYQSTVPLIHSGGTHLILHGEKNA